jgi:hypothetical protein
LFEKKKSSKNINRYIGQQARNNGGADPHVHFAGRIKKMRDLMAVRRKLGKICNIAEKRQLEVQMKNQETGLQPLESQFQGAMLKHQGDHLGASSSSRKPLILNKMDHG